MVKGDPGIDLNFSISINSPDNGPDIACFGVSSSPVECKSKGHPLMTSISTIKDRCNQPIYTETEKNIQTDLVREAPPLEGDQPTTSATLPTSIISTLNKNDNFDNLVFNTDNYPIPKIFNSKEHHETQSGHLTVTNINSHFGQISNGSTLPSHSTNTMTKPYN